MTTRPWGAPPIEMSKYTLFVTSALQSSGAESAVGQPSASAGATAAAATAAAGPTRAARREGCGLAFLRLGVADGLARDDPALRATANGGGDRGGDAHLG